MVKRKRATKRLKELLSRTTILKATKLEYAKSMLSSGQIQFGFLGYYRKIWEDDESKDGSAVGDKSRGDENEGDAVVNTSGVDVFITSNIEPYVFSASRADISIKDLEKISSDYDCYVVINDVAIFSRRIEACIKKASLKYELLRGPVKYTRGYKISDKEKKDLSYEITIFQKNDSYESQNEYRLSLFTPPSLIPVPATQTRPNSLKDFKDIKPPPENPQHEHPLMPSELGWISKEGNWILEIGNCEDIMTIVRF